jgi:hypothetical protein
MNSQNGSRRRRGRRTRRPRRQVAQGVGPDPGPRRGRFSAVNGEVVRVGRLPIPPRMTTTLTYSSIVNITNVLATAANVRYDPSFCYDVDPILGSTAMPFFSELAGLYRYYRCLSARIVVEAVNRETFPSVLYVTPVNFDPGANYSAVTAANYLSNPLARSTPLSPITGNSRGTIRNYFRISDFSGSKWTGDVDLYSARADGTGGSPVNTAWFTVGIRSDGGLYGANGGVFCNITIHIEICFFEETSPSA